MAAKGQKSRNDAEGKPTKIQFYAKAARAGNKREERVGDCPFCQRIYMILCLKNAKGTCPFDVYTVNPKLESGALRTPPVLRDPVSEREFTDVSEMADYLEQVFTDIPLKAEDEEANAVGLDIYHAFNLFCRNWDPKKDEILKKKLINGLQELEDFLSDEDKPEGPFLNGPQLCLADCSLLPKLHHVRVAGFEFKEFQIPDEFTAIHLYLDAWYQTDVYKETEYADEEVIDTWKEKRGK
ncbi:chloride intracellular channel protein 4-like isoform X2 [Amphiura filiformis]|uniref:chloride intracellular channel protein 4-like isoform X2 n=1 Tax=Amphiura filiformis TaxID=82378 RepID=UPI003B225CC8